MSGLISLTAVVACGTLAIMGTLIVAREVIASMAGKEQYDQADVEEYTIQYVDAA